MPMYIYVLYLYLYKYLICTPAHLIYIYKSMSVLIYSNYLVLTLHAGQYYRLRSVWSARSNLPVIKELILYDLLS